MTVKNSKDLIDVLKKLDSMRSLAIGSSNFSSFQENVDYIHSVMPLSEKLLDQYKRLPNFETAKLNEECNLHMDFIKAVRQYYITSISF